MPVIEEHAAAIIVPADYLEDMRSALVAELVNDTEALRSDQTDLVADETSFHRQDRDASALLLARDFRVFEEILRAEADVEVIAERTTLFHVFEALCRLLTDRLVVQMGYGPVDMGAALDLTARLRWAAGEAARVLPSEALDERSITVDRDTRDVLHRLAMWDAPDFELGHPLARGERDEAFRMRGKLDLIMTLLDDLGWETQPSDDRTTYAITVDPEPLAAWLAEKRNERQQMILDDRASLSHQEAGDAGYYEDGKSQAESIASSRDAIAGHEADVTLISDVLDRLSSVEAERVA